MRGGMMMAAARKRIPTGDPYFSSVSSLMHFDGNLTDVKGLTWTAQGNAAANGTAKFGSNALACDGTTDYLITTADTSLTLSADFTIEMWIKHNSTAMQLFVMTEWPANNGLIVSFSHSTANKYSLFVGSYSEAVPLLESTNTFASSAYRYLAIKRSGNNWEMRVDGASEATATGAYTIDTPIRTLGAYFEANGSGNNGLLALNGTIDDWRITKGVARDISVVPTAAFPDS